MRHGSYVFLDVTWLAAILKPVLNHKEKQLRDGTISLDIAQGRSILLSTREHKRLWRRLESEGILHPELARLLWPHDLSEYVLPTLRSIGLAFSLSDDEHDELVVMLRLPEERPSTIEEDLQNFRDGNYPAIRCLWKVFMGAPPGAIERVLTRCCSLGATKTFWRYGVLVKGDFGGKIGGRFALLMEYVDEELHMEVHGNLASIGPWVALSYAMSAMLSITWEFPGLGWEASVKCPTHSTGELEVSREVSGLRSVLYADSALPLCHRTCGLTKGLPMALIVVRSERHPWTLVCTDNRQLCSCMTFP